MAALDVPEPQILFSTPGHVSGDWAHLVLLKRAAGGRWIVLTPDLTVEPRDISTVAIMALGRGAAFPPVIASSVFTFGDAVTVEQLSGFHARAVSTAALLRDDGAQNRSSAGPPASWRVCHTGCDLFAETVSDDVVNGPDGVVSGSIGLAKIDGYVWPVERVPDGEFLSWLNYMRNGSQRDERLAGMVMDASGRRFVSLHDYLALLRPVDRSKSLDYPHRGPSAAVEVLRGVRGSGRELIPYDELWASQSGIHPSSALRAEHRTIFHVLAMMQSWDQVDIPAMASGELLCRRALQIQRAVAANPRAPSFLGLARMTEHSMDERSGLTTQEFSAHFAAGAETEARIMRQTRLLRGELAAQQSGIAPPAVDPDDVDDLGTGAATTTSNRAKKRAVAKAKAVASAAAAAVAAGRPPG